MLYLWLKALHIIFVITWMAGLFYLPRLFAYHANAKRGSELDLTLQTMERKLLRIIMNPSLILVFAIGIWLIIVTDAFKGGVWFHIKFTLVLALAGFHGYLAVLRKKFLNGTNTHSAKFYKIINEIPSILMVAIVILVVIKPL